MTQDMTKDMILHTMTKKLVCNWRTRVLSAAHSSSLTGALTQEWHLCADEITSRLLRDYGSPLTRLRLAISMLLMITLGTGSVWGQTDYSGVYYLGNGNGYNVGNVAGNFYLVPATNANYDTDQPHLTTSKVNHADNSCWYIIKNGAYYNIIHAADGKYLAANPAYDGTSGNDVGRLRVHLEAMDTPDNKTLFEIKPNNNGGYNIRHKDMADIINKNTTTYLDPAGGNIEGTDLTNYRTMTTSSGSVNVGGGIGYWTDELAARWYFENALSIDAPTITDNNDGTFTIATALGATIYYTTDGSTPTTLTPAKATTSVNVIQTESMKAIKAIAKAESDPFPTLVTTYNLPVCEMPSISVSDGVASLTCTTAESTIYYTTDGSDPTNGTSYTSTFSISDGMVIKAIAKKSGLSNSDIVSLTIVQTPTITIDGEPSIYNGTGQEPAVTVKKGETVIDPSEYTISYSNNINVGSSATVTITDNEGGEYYVVGSTTFTISPMSIGSGTTPATGISIDVSMSGSDYVVTVKHGNTTLTEGTDYTWTGGPEVTVTGIGNYSGTAKATYVPVTPGYYALHQNGAGYLKVNGEGVNLSNDGTFRYSNVFDNNGNCIWYLTPEGYLQNEYFYLNVANNRTLYLDVTPVTRWRTEEITGNAHGKQRIKINDGTQDLYICYDSSNKVIKLQSGTTNIYNACPITITEESWNSTPSASDLTLQSPQLVTYLRASFKQNISYEFYNDAGTKVAEQKKDRTVYGTLAYVSGGDGKGTDWDIDESGILYNKKASGDVEFTATYNILPADPVARAAHSTAATKGIKYKVTQKPLALTADMDYLLYSISGGNNYRYPYDDGVTDGDPVKPDGKGGTDNTSVLTDPGTNGSTRNLQISWKITADAEGFYTFKNSSTDKYLYFDENPHASSDYGVLRLGDAPEGNSAKFRLYKTSDSNYGACYYIIPYSKQFAVYKSDGLANGLYVALNNKDYTSSSTKVISLYKPTSDHSTWCIYKYEAGYRIRKDFNIKVETANTVSAAGNYLFSSEGWYGKYIKESPNTGSGQNGLVISGSYKDQSNVNYLWTITGLGDYITIAGGSKDETGTWTVTTTGGTDPRKLTITVSSMPASTVSGVVKLRLSGGVAPNVLTSVDADEKSVGFTILGNGSVSFTSITSLSQISSSTSAYRLSDAQGSNFAYSDTNKPTVSSFSGILDGNGQTITGLNAPLFETLTNGTVHDVNLSGVDISGNSGPTGAIAGTANGGSRIYNVGILDGEVGSSDNVCGGLVGLLDGSARVINCFSYAEITGGTIVGGIVGKNNFKTTSNDPRTMVMNCMFYGEISGGNSKAPVYNGEIITNRSDQNGVSNFNYFWAGASYVQTLDIDVYNCALSAETRFLNRFEFFRHLLNSNRALAAWWATGSRDNKDEMLKWVMEPSQIGTDTPYPILKVSKNTSGTTIKYPSVVNIDAEHAEAIDAKNEHYNEGRKLTNMGGTGNKAGKLSVTIQMGSQGSAPYGKPTGADLKDLQPGETSKTIDLVITDKDPKHFNFNYGKVQLPYYNDYGTKNYTGNRVVTGWKIVSISGGAHSFTSGSDATASVSTNEATKGDITLTTPYNFADRKSTQKDLYGEGGSNRIFNQGAYFDVPEGVTSITIEPYWAQCVYVSDAYPDVVYNQDMSTAANVTTVGGGQRYTNGQSYPINGENQVVYTSMGNAAGQMPTSGNVYDNAIVLVGNVHSLDLSDKTDSKEYTIMSIDLDKDNEPDYSYILRFNGRTRLHPVRVDFLNVIGLGMAQKSKDGTGTYNFGIMQPLGWFEATNTSLFRVTQFEYDYAGRKESPMILQGGVIEQWVTVGGSEKTIKEAKSVSYYHVGGNVWFKEFHIGVHQDKIQDEFFSPHPPISVTGGDFDEFYLTGLYNTPNENSDDNAECYINGGRFGKVAGTGMQGIGGIEKDTQGNKTGYSNGDIIWQIDNADIDEFYAGGINAAHIAEGDIFTVISNSRVDQFCGGPKFGNMNSDKKVVTNAENCTFRIFFGAGYGGNSYNRRYPSNKNNLTSDPDWDTWVKGELKYRYNSDFSGVETRINYQYIPMSNNTQSVARLFVDHVSFSLATTYDVTSKLTGCTITKDKLGRLDLTDNDKRLGNFFGGGSLGKIVGDVKSTLINCTVKGNVFGAGYSASKPKVDVMTQTFQNPPKYNKDLGAYLDAKLPATLAEYEWEPLPSGSTTYVDNTKHILYAKAEDLEKSNLGSVNGDVTLTLTTSGSNGKTTIGLESDTTTGNVYGGGDASYVLGATHTITVNLQGKTEVLGNVYGGGNEGLVEGSTEVNILE